MYCYKSMETSNTEDSNIDLKVQRLTITSVLESSVFLVSLLVAT